MQGIDEEAMHSELARHIQTELSFDPDIPIESDDEIIASGLVDSFSLIELRGWIEKRYGVYLPDHCVTAESFATVRKMVPIIRDAMAQATTK